MTKNLMVNSQIPMPAKIEAVNVLISSWEFSLFLEAPNNLEEISPVPRV